MKWLDGVDWIRLAQERDRWQAADQTLTNLRVPYKSKNFLKSLETIVFLRRSMLCGVSYGKYIKSKRKIYDYAVCCLATVDLHM
jgi:hypothetical protein